jgi:TetR/AcrR family tetracycline transcriptional repressor
VQLRRQDVLDGAIAILDEYGLADLTMRRLATSLHVQPGALYWHFPNKQTLLGAIADHILSVGRADLADRTSTSRRAALPARRSRTGRLHLRLAAHHQPHP